VDPGPANLVALTEGIHSKEALELVREHMLGVMGAAASNKFSTELIKMSKFQMAQVCVCGLVLVLVGRVCAGAKFAGARADWFGVVLQARVGWNGLAERHLRQWP
jgi:hypothetical protein